MMPVERTGRSVGAGFSANPSGVGGLKNWKPEKLTVCTPDQIPRISEIQVFSRPEVPGVLQF